MGCQAHWTSVPILFPDGVIDMCYFHVPSQITPQIYLSSRIEGECDECVRCLGINAIVRLVYSSHIPPPDVALFAFPIEDLPTQPLHIVIPLALAFMDDHIKQGHKVLVHCDAGISRSTSIVAAYLCWKQRIPVMEAIRQIQAARPHAQPNLGFLLQIGYFCESNMDEMVAAHQQ